MSLSSLPVCLVGSLGLVGEKSGVSSPSLPEAVGGSPSESSSLNLGSYAEVDEEDRDRWNLVMVRTRVARRADKWTGPCE